MLTQVFVIHGGDSFGTYEEYLQFLKDFPIELAPQGKGWKSGLGEVLGDEYEVIQPLMPNKFNARFAEWKIWFEKYVPHLRDGVILVGHSLGGSFLAKYLSEERLPIRVAGTFLVAAPYDFNGDPGIGDFALTPASLGLLRAQAGKVFLYHSEDDPVVSIAELAKFQAKLPDAHSRTFSDRHHFIGEEFPEIVDDIRSLRIEGN